MSKTGKKKEKKNEFLKSSICSIILKANNFEKKNKNYKNALAFYYPTRRGCRCCICTVVLEKERSKM